MLQPGSPGCPFRYFGDIDERLLPGLVEGEFFGALIRESVKNFDEMLGKAASYINVEEAQAARWKADKVHALANKSESKSSQPLAQPFPRSKDARPGFPPDPISKTAQRVEAIQAPKPGQWGPCYCTYHRSHTRSTRDCVQFACDSRRTVELGLPPLEIAPKLQRLMPNHPVATGHSGRSLPENAGQGSQQPCQGKEQTKILEEENRRNVVIREIDMISGGPTDGDSARARKSHERHLEIHALGCSREQAVEPVISFGPHDLERSELLHDDVLIIKAIIANNYVARVFVDTGSSINVLFKNAFDGMQIDASEL
ncbi:uncharacterized protein LOC122048682 [Zingiber officinale]|uniref:uncharacterized protein LOC122048682 n=1 Tax=Zingiber officinale TaxID=94328 RepID=UPI001C4AA5D4|nr:uncharacterized protein LOC122048682 [Zingiber officinale]